MILVIIIITIIEIFGVSHTFLINLIVLESDVAVLTS